MKAEMDHKRDAETSDQNSMSRDASEFSYERRRLDIDDDAFVADDPGEDSSFDSNRAIHESHAALLYLLSHPEEFQRAIEDSGAERTKSLQEWHNEDERESLASASVCASADDNRSAGNSKPLPFIVFSDDAEVVLPQAHTVSQLFGSELKDGIELEAAAGIRSISQLFLRWLALMPGGDHINIIDPPGLTVMKIAGGRYRVTAAHRVVWTWMNCIAGNPLQPGDLVTMTVVDVFETDNDGCLLSYCPTFDNRAVRRTHLTAEALRKSSSKIMWALQSAKRSSLGQTFMHKANDVARSVQLHVARRSSGPSSREISGASEACENHEERVA